MGNKASKSQVRKGEDTVWKPLKEPAQSRNLGSGDGRIAFLLERWQAIPDKNEFGIMLLMYGITNVMMYFLLPTEFLLGWTLLNAGAMGWIAVNLQKGGKKEEGYGCSNDDRQRTFYEGGWSSAQVSESGNDEMSQRRFKGEKRGKKEVFELKFEFKDQKLEGRNLKTSGKRRSNRAITFPSDDDESGEESVKPIRYDDSSGIEDTYLAREHEENNGIVIAKEKEKNPIDEGLNVVLALWMLYHSKTARKVNIFIDSADDKTVTLQVYLYDKVEVVRTELQKRIGIPVSGIKLAFGGKILKDDTTLLEYGVQANSTLFMLYAVIGGMKSPARGKKEAGSMEIEKTQRRTQD